MYNSIGHLQDALESRFTRLGSDNSPGTCPTVTGQGYLHEKMRGELRIAWFETYTNDPLDERGLPDGLRAYE